MKVILLNGSPHSEGNTAMALDEVGRALNEDGIETVKLWIGNKPMPGCISCYKCEETGVCIYNTGVYAELRRLLPECSGIVVGSPTYYAGPNGSLCALLDRLFFSSRLMLENKVAAAVAICRRGGSDATVERLNKYFAMTNMPIPTSQYWNIAFGLHPGDVLKDAEGMQTMRTLGHNMALLIKSLADKPVPVREEHVWTHFIR